MRMVELQPRLFFEAPQAAVEAQVSQADHMLREGLAGADINFMVTEDPAMLFEDLASLATGAPPVSRPRPGGPRAERARSASA